MIWKVERFDDLVMQSQVSRSAAPLVTGQRRSFKVTGRAYKHHGRFTNVSVNLSQF